MEIYLIKFIISVKKIKNYKQKFHQYPIKNCNKYLKVQKKKYFNREQSNQIIFQINQIEYILN